MFVLPFYGMFRQTFRNVPANFSHDCYFTTGGERQLLKAAENRQLEILIFYGSFYWLNYDFVSWIINWRPHINLDIKIAGTVAIARPVSYKASDLHMIKWKILLNLARQLALEKIPPAKDPKRTFFKRCSDILHVTFCNIAQQI